MGVRVEEADLLIFLLRHTLYLNDTSPKLIAVLSQPNKTIFCDSFNLLKFNPSYIIKSHHVQ